MAETTLYWHDYETFGADPRNDRPVQFAGLRTDRELNVIGESLLIYCRPPRDALPEPEACLITGITPQRADKLGLREADFIGRIHEELGMPGTCGLGYNTLRFDDEVTRYGLYRNFFDPYEREWRNGNSRWDMIDVARLMAALRPEGILWPRDDSGRVSFRLEDLTAANGIMHEGAHDALVDVKATIDLARLIKTAQPRLYDFVWRNRGKREVASLLRVGEYQPLIHVSGKYTAEQQRLAVVVALAQHPANPNGVIVCDLSTDPESWLALDSDALRLRLYTPSSERGEGELRIPLKTVHINKAPVVAPLSVMRPQDSERLGVSLEQCRKHCLTLQAAAPALLEKLDRVFSSAPDLPPDITSDPDTQLYVGGFFSDSDRKIMTRLRRMTPQQLADSRFDFQDARLPEMLFRYRARNYPESLSAAELGRWEVFRKKRLLSAAAGGQSRLTHYRNSLEKLEARPELSETQRSILSDLRLWEQEIIG
ncbi:exodeoxyribonuclease I [Candidatus Methylospira mobilis]|uniref:Exodeoxyribonuclease I n=1 Tax=Candidatus Methylospira mobilis TaxID=1808979 RepID=A0A5Q0BG08_9GAMM|nr:exodeoxyribonuclease I [Candidatus Methylospira mobilis]QFY42795.1 exodeoxyribonuclease I [Candidatus Methylospira mobilis]